MKNLNQVLEHLNRKLMANGHAPLSLGQLKLVNDEYFRTVREVQQSNLITAPMVLGEVRFQRSACNGR
jgi:hypothetical protein